MSNTEMNEKLKGDVLIIDFKGELMGGEEIKIFQNRIHKAIQENTTSVVVDMENVKWMNSSGLGMLMAGLTTLRGSEGDLKLAQVSDRVRRPIEVTRLNQVFEIFESVDEAVDSYISGG